MPPQFPRLFLAALWLTLLFASLSIRADETSIVESPTSVQGGVQFFERQFFDRFAPQTALDIAERVPGFAIDFGQDLRGFGQGGGNVLINGERPSSKSVGLQEVLERIPADQVSGVRILQGAQVTAQTAGQAIVLDVLVEKGQLSGTWRSTSFYNTERRSLDPTGELSLSSTIGDWGLLTKVTAFSQRLTNPGQRIDTNAVGDTVRLQTEQSPFTNRYFSLSSEAVTQAGEGELTLAGKVSYSKMDRDTTRLTFQDLATEQPDLQTNFSSIRRALNAEFSVRYANEATKGWQTRHLGLLSVGDSSSTARSRLISIPEVFLDATTSASEGQSQELITRSTFGLQSDRSWTPTFGLGVAYNRLVNRFALQREDAEGNGLAVAVPAADLSTDELRAEVFANILWRPSAQWIFDAGIAIEESRIAVSGDAQNQQQLLFAKPHATVTFAPAESFQLRGELRRQVGQLAFTDFVASAQLTEDRVFAGNPELRQETSNIASLTFDWRSGSGRALNLTAFHEWRQDVLEQLLLPSGSPGLGNAGDGEVWGVRGSGSLPLSPFIKGGLLETSFLWQDSSFVDPLTGIERPLNGITSPRLEIEFRQDLVGARFAWGVGVKHEGENESFFVSERSQNDNGLGAFAFLETTRFWGSKLNLRWWFVGDRELTRRRTFFEPNRSGPPIGSQSVSRTIPSFLAFTIEKQF